MVINEIMDLKPKIISDLKEKGVDIIDVDGTFDLYVDLGKGKGYFIELKVAKIRYKAWATKKGLNLTNQTQAIRSMKNLPIIFACDKDDDNICYLILPEELKLLADEREKHDAILIAAKHLKRKSYNAALNELVEYLNNGYS